MKAKISHDGLWPTCWRWEVLPSSEDLPNDARSWHLLNRPGGSALTRAGAEAKAARAAKKWTREVARTTERWEVDV